MAKIPELHSDITGGHFLAAVEENLRNRVREGLRKPLMEQAMKMVDEAVDEAMVGLKADIEAYIEQAHDEMRIAVLIKRVDPRQPTANEDEGNSD